MATTLEGLYFSVRLSDAPFYDTFKLNPSRGSLVTGSNAGPLFCKIRVGFKSSLYKSSTRRDHYEKDTILFGEGTLLRWMTIAMTPTMDLSMMVANSQ